MSILSMLAIKFDIGFIALIHVGSSMTKERRSQLMIPSVSYVFVVQS